MKTRYLTKSRFKLAMECPTKLFYTGKPEYSDQKKQDSFLEALAEGGFQVGELAKCFFPGGADIKSLDAVEALAETQRLLQQEHAIIYEAAIATDKLFIRVDILTKHGNHLNIYECKAKSFDSSHEVPFVSDQGTFDQKWLPYLQDVAFQKYVVKQAYPGFGVSANLLLVDKSVKCPTDGLNQKFRIVRDSKGRPSVTVSESFMRADLSPPILQPVCVDSTCERIYDDVPGNNGKFSDYPEMVEYYATAYVSDNKIASPVSIACGSCEFCTDPDTERQGLKSGKKECWKAMLGWNDSDFESWTVFDLWNFKGKSQLIDAGKIKMDDLSESDIMPRSDAKPVFQSVSASGCKFKSIKTERILSGLIRKTLRNKWGNGIIHYIS
jgi:hypothetical protein